MFLIFYSIFKLGIDFEYLLMKSFSLQIIRILYRSIAVGDNSVEQNECGKHFLMDLFGAWKDKSVEGRVLKLISFGKH